MKNNLFLTGDRRVGKSTCIDRALEQVRGEVRGFRTYFADETRAQLQLSDPAGRQTQVAARRRAEGGFQVFEEAFEGCGVELLHSGWEADLMLMDELGKLETGCPRFRSAVLETLERPVPVLGVLRQGEGEWLDLLHRHSAIEVLTVTEDNREWVGEQLSRWLRELGLVPEICPGV